MASCAASTEGRVRRGGLDDAPAILNHTVADNRTVDIVNSAYDTKPRVLDINRVCDSIGGGGIEYSTRHVEV